tara:strand:+ start:90 stop:671 length:582 start_codon:yes stop_codon:yes gene_type:complete
MISYKESLKILKETDALQEGHFILSSGLHSDKYIQCAKLLSKPNKAKDLCKSLAEKISNKFKNIDIILSPAMGGIVIGYEIGRILNVETIFAERVKGVFCLRRGFEIKKNQNILIIEDVITTGKSSIECSKIVENIDAKILGFACIIDRSNGKSLIKEKIVSQIQIEIPTYSADQLPNHLKKTKPIKPGSRGN